MRPGLTPNCHSVKMKRIKSLCLLWPCVNEKRHLTLLRLLEDFEIALPVGPCKYLLTSNLSRASPLVFVSTDAMFTSQIRHCLTLPWDFGVALSHTCCYTAKKWVAVSARWSEKLQRYKLCHMRCGFSSLTHASPRITGPCTIVQHFLHCFIHFQDSKCQFWLGGFCSFWSAEINFTVIISENVLDVFVPSSHPWSYSARKSCLSYWHVVAGVVPRPL